MDTRAGTVGSNLTPHTDGLDDGLAESEQTLLLGRHLSDAGLDSYRSSVHVGEVSGAAIPRSHSIHAIHSHPSRNNRDTHSSGRSPQLPYRSRHHGMDIVKWWSFCSSLLCMLCGGTLYLFGAYASQLKSSLGYSQTEINVIASAGGFGLYLSGPLMGAWVDRHGARPIALASSLLLWGGYTGMAWMVSETLFTSSFLFMSVFYCMVGLGSAGVYNAALKTNIQNFDQKEHGFAIGVSVSAFGLSALVFSSFSRMFVAIHESHEIVDAPPIVLYPNGTAHNDVNYTYSEPTLDIVRFLMFMGIATGLVSLLAALFGLQEVSVKTEPLLDRDVVEPSPIGTCNRSCCNETSEYRRDSTHDVEGQRSFRDSSGYEDERFHRPASHHDETTSAAPTSTSASTSSTSTFLKESHAWGLFLPFMTLAGMGLMYMNNIGSIVLAILPENTDSAKASAIQAFMVSMISLFNCLGRIVTGVASDKAQVYFGTQRLTFLIIGSMFILLAQTMGLLMVSSIATLTLCTCILGFGYGSIFSSTPAIVGKWFGIQSFGSNWGYFQIGPALGGYIWNIVFGMWMDSQRPHDVHDPLPLPGNGGKDLECKGTRCFRGAFFMCFLAAVTSTVALIRLYQLRRHRRQTLSQ
ncbi:hypothetical protein BASA50_002788 [Batrachochytrium salamandrivorans]|uniref:Nodulin-like domain-containing protein n=1 Tax=Batrachochytrium salamandrivorans TaxID=1357716 RepID=A0ABQ8FLJ9_9FUNG|nr:hypothetical protein BASA62_004229 [Batrachochytrium salamandrivorans]KAH6580563.1 hypothetical protein BASA61_009575 [Batrachochytrium salamandrivorans]KAH6599763.1 hypothetical protein BASA50_002788 [Batrachochytrium salamandrivorans]KAH9274062.1 hypothetical protein BASA83_003704 [Batrachochytrium salamandrivorans]